MKAAALAALHTIAVLLALALVAVLLGALSGCGGGGDDAPTPPPDQLTPRANCKQQPGLCA